MKTIATTIPEHPFLKSLSLRAREALLDKATETTCVPGQVIFRQGEPANRLYLILSGAVALEAKDPRQKATLVQCLREGEILGWSWLFQPFVWQFNAKAVEDTRLLVVDGARLLIACQEDPDLGFELLKAVAPVVIQRLQSARKKLLASPAAKVLAQAEPLKPGAHSSVRCDQEDLEKVINQHPFTRGMRPEFIKELTNSAMLLEFNTNETIFREGDVANRFYLVESGAVVLEAPLPDGTVIPLQVIAEGDVLGWSWLFSPYYWHFHARALQPTRAIFFYGTRLRETCEQNRALGCELMRRMVRVIMQRLQATRQQLVDIQVLDAAVDGK